MPDVFLASPQSANIVLVIIGMVALLKALPGSFVVREQPSMIGDRVEWDTVEWDRVEWDRVVLQERSKIALLKAVCGMAVEKGRLAGRQRDKLVLDTFGPGKVVRRQARKKKVARQGLGKIVMDNHVLGKVAMGMAELEADTAVQEAVALLDAAQASSFAELCLGKKIVELVDAHSAGWYTVSWFGDMLSSRISHRSQP